MAPGPGQRHPRRDVPRHRPHRPPGRAGLDRHGQTRAGQADRLTVQPQRPGRRPPPAGRRTRRTRDPRALRHPGPTRPPARASLPTINVTRCPATWRAGTPSVRRAGRSRWQRPAVPAFYTVGHCAQRLLGCDDPDVVADCRETALGCPCDHVTDGRNVSSAVTLAARQSCQRRRDGPRPGSIASQRGAPQAAADSAVIGAVP
jgi:hypothetical protein